MVLCNSFKSARVGQNMGDNEVFPSWRLLVWSCVAIPKPMSSVSEPNRLMLLNGCLMKFDGLRACPSSRTARLGFWPRKGSPLNGFSRLTASFFELWGGKYCLMQSDVPNLAEEM